MVAERVGRTRCVQGVENRPRGVRRAVSQRCASSGAKCIYSPGSRMFNSAVRSKQLAVTQDIATTQTHSVHGRILCGTSTNRALSRRCRTGFLDVAIGRAFLLCRPGPRQTEFPVVVVRVGGDVICDSSDSMWSDSESFCTRLLPPSSFWKAWYIQCESESQ